MAMYDQNLIDYVQGGIKRLGKWLQENDRLILARIAKPVTEVDFGFGGSRKSNNNQSWSCAMASSSGAPVNCFLQLKVEENIHLDAIVLIQWCSCLPASNCV